MFFARIGPWSETGAPVGSHAVVNAGTGRARTFNDVAKILMEVHGPAKIEYVPFPEDLNARYQHFTEADLTGLRQAGCNLGFTPLEQGVRETFESIESVNFNIVTAEESCLRPLPASQQRHLQGMPQDQHALFG